jgi:hypothetical protein
VPDVNDGDSDGGHVKRVYERFRALGMPEGVSLEAFGRVMGGHGTSATSGGAGAGVSLNSAAGNLKRAEKGKGKDERMRLRLNSRLRGRDQQQPQQQEEEEKEGEGDWNTALTFLSTHLVGRQEARKARGVISRWVGFSFALFLYHLQSTYYYPDTQTEQERNSRIPPNTPACRESKCPLCPSSLAVVVLMHPIN